MAKHGEMDELVPQFWIGDLASATGVELKKNNIKHVVTVGKEIGEVKNVPFSDLTSKHYDFEDDDQSLILPYFEEMCAFIREGLDAGGTLVVSYAGVSRSAVVALAFVMKLMKLTYEEGLKMVSARRLLSLNHNFAIQLKLWERMKCTFNKNSEHYSVFLSALKAEKATKHNLLSRAKVFAPSDSELAERLSSLVKKQGDSYPFKKKNFAKAPKDIDHPKVFACGHCKQKLFLPQNLITLGSGKLKDWSESPYTYIEPMEWMKGELNNVQGTFHCPSCNLGLGEWDWEGTLLTAETKVVPSFRMHKGCLCLITKSTKAKSGGKEKVVQGYKGWATFVKDHPPGYSSPFLPASEPFSPRTAQYSGGADDGAAGSDSEENGEKGGEKEKGGGQKATNGENHGGLKKSPKRKPPPPPPKGKKASEDDNTGEGSKNSDSAKNGSNEEAQPEAKKGLKSFMGRFKKNSGSTKKGSTQTPAGGEKNPSGNLKGSKEPSNGKGKEKNPANNNNHNNNHNKESIEDYGEDMIKPVPKSLAQQAIEVTCPEDLPKELLKVIKASKITDEDVAENFLILLNCLHFLTKRQFVLRPKRDDGEKGGDDEEGVIKIGGAKKKKKKNKSTVPPSEELITEGDVKKAFKVQEIVGEGGFGRVHSARNLKGKGRVAIKKMSHLEDREKARNLREINFLRVMDHPCVVKYHCSYLVREELWVVMEFMEGGTLTEALKGFSFEEKHIAFAAKEMLKGIKYLHGRNLVHRDLKSGNIMMTTQGDVKLIDFGLCVDLNEEKDPEHMVGSPFWMPPEMIKRQVYGPAVDIWSFAICLLELANGQPPNRRSALKAMFVAGTTGYPQPFNKPEHWSSNFKDFIGRCLEMDPARRATADELLKHPFLEKADTKKGMKKILSHIFLQNTIDMMNLGGI